MTLRLPLNKRINSIYHITFFDDSEYFYLKGGPTMYDLGLEAFGAVVHTGSMSRAAARLNLAQPTISKRIQVLEQQIGITLLERGHGVKLTPAGEAFAVFADKWALLKEQIETFPVERLKLSLSIGTVISVLSSIFPSLYFALSRHQPRIKLRVITSNSMDQYNAIEQRRVDVAFSLLDRFHPDVVVEKCYTEPMVVLRRFDANHIGFSTLHPNDLDSNYELYVRWGDSYQTWHDKWWDPYCWGRNYIATALLLEALQQDAQNWAIAPLTFARSALNNGAFSIFHLAESPPERTVYKLSHKDPTPSSEESLEIFNHYLNLILKNEIDSILDSSVFTDTK